MENCYGAAELTSGKIYPTGNFEIDAAKRLNDAVKISAAPLMQPILREIRQTGDKTWAHWKSQFEQDPVQHGDSAAPPAPAPRVTPARSALRSHTGKSADNDEADQGEDAPIYAMEMRKSISDETSAKVAAVIQKPLEKIMELLQQLEEQSRSNAEANRELSKGILILRECLTIVRDNKNVDWNGSASSIQAALATNAASSHAASSRPPPTRRPPWLGAGKPAPKPAAPPATSVNERSDVEREELPEPWPKLLDILLDHRNKKYHEGDCVLCPPGKGVPHPTSKCGFLFLLTSKGRAWLRKRSASQAGSQEAAQQYAERSGHTSDGIVNDMCMVCYSGENCNDEEVAELQEILQGMHDAHFDDDTSKQLVEMLQMSASA